MAALSTCFAFSTAIATLANVPSNSSAKPLLSWSLTFGTLIPVNLSNLSCKLSCLSLGNLFTFSDAAFFFVSAWLASSVSSWCSFGLIAPSSTALANFSFATLSAFSASSTAFIASSFAWSKSSTTPLLSWSFMFGTSMPVSTSNLCGNSPFWFSGNAFTFASAVAFVSFAFLDASSNSWCSFGLMTPSSLALVNLSFATLSARSASTTAFVASSFAWSKSSATPLLSLSLIPGISMPVNLLNLCGKSPFWLSDKAFTFASAAAFVSFACLDAASNSWCSFGLITPSLLALANFSFASLSARSASSTAFVASSFAWSKSSATPLLSLSLIFGTSMPVNLSNLCGKSTFWFSGNAFTLSSAATLVSFACLDAATNSWCSFGLITPSLLALANFSFASLSARSASSTAFVASSFAWSKSSATPLLSLSLIFGTSMPVNLSNLCGKSTFWFSGNAFTLSSAATLVSFAFLDAASNSWCSFGLITPSSLALVNASLATLSACSASSIAFVASSFALSMLSATPLLSLSLIPGISMPVNLSNLCGKSPFWFSDKAFTFASASFFFVSAWLDAASNSLCSLGLITPSSLAFVNASLATLSACSAASTAFVASAFALSMLSAIPLLSWSFISGTAMPVNTSNLCGKSPFWLSGNAFTFASAATLVSFAFLDAASNSRCSFGLITSSSLALVNLSFAALSDCSAASIAFVASAFDLSRSSATPLLSLSLISGTTMPVNTSNLCGKSPFWFSDKAFTFASASFFFVSAWLDAASNSWCSFGLITPSLLALANFSFASLSARSASSTAFVASDFTWSKSSEIPLLSWSLILGTTIPVNLSNLCGKSPFWFSDKAFTFASAAFFFVSAWLDASSNSLCSLGLITPSSLAFVNLSFAACSACSASTTAFVASSFAWLSTGGCTCPLASCSLIFLISLLTFWAIGFILTVFNSKLTPCTGFG